MSFLFSSNEILSLSLAADILVSVGDWLRARADASSNSPASRISRQNPNLGRIWCVYRLNHRMPCSETVRRRSPTSNRQSPNDYPANRGAALPRQSGNDSGPESVIGHGDGNAFLKSSKHHDGRIIRSDTATQTQLRMRWTPPPKTRTSSDALSPEHRR